MKQQHLIIGITGASGIIYGIRLLEHLKNTAITSHLIISKSAELTRATETQLNAKELRALSDFYYRVTDLTAPIASGSFKTMGMVIAPCSMRTLAEIAHGMSTTLLSRAADVTLKERRRLVLLTRESPLHQTHLENMLKVTQMGGIIAPPVPAFYNHPDNLLDIVDHSVGRALDLFDLEINWVKRWGTNE